MGTSTAQSSAKASQTTKPGSKLGVVQQCTISTGYVHKLTYDGNAYCMTNLGKKGQDEAIDSCKKMNAGLPLPKSKNETAEYLKITGSQKVWIGLKDVTKSGDMAAWKDLDGNPIGNRYVNLRVSIFNFRLFSVISLTLLKVGNGIYWKKVATNGRWISCIL